MNRYELPIEIVAERERDKFQAGELNEEESLGLFL